MRCPHCLKENEQPGKFCMYCGGSMEPPPAPTPAGFCPRCGAPRASEAAFCENCGTHLTVVRSTATEPPAAKTKTIKQDKGGSWVAFGAFAGVLLLVAGSGVAWFFAQEGESLPAPPVKAVDPRPAVTPAPTPAVTQESPPAIAKKEAAFRHFTQGMEAMELIEQGRGDENTLINALEHAEQASGLDPTVAAYWHLLGYVYSHFKGDQQASVMAEDALQKALAINPGNTATRLLLARLLLEREAYALALDQLEWAGRKDAKLINSLLVADMCRAYVADELAERGEKFFREMLQQRGDSSSLRLGLAILLQEQGKKDEALRQLASVLGDSKASADDLEHARLLDKVWRGGKA